MKIKFLFAVVMMFTFSLFADMPEPGEAAPQFEGKDQDGRPVRLADFLGKKNVLLYFYPKDFTGGCTKEACGLRDRMGELQTNNVEVIGVSFDTAQSHQKFKARYGLNFTLVADPDGTIVNLYDVKMPLMKMAKRVSFLIGTDGRIAHVTDAMNPQTHFNEMQVAIAALNKK